MPPQQPTSKQVRLLCTHKITITQLTFKLCYSQIENRHFCFLMILLNKKYDI